MHAKLNELIDEAIQMELNVASLYLLFHHQLKEDAIFWWELSLEEKNHAALLKTVKEMLKIQRLDVPEDILPEDIDSLKASNALIKQMQTTFQQDPSRETAFRLALEIENSAGELHYDRFMHHAPDTKIREVFKKLNGEDMDHAYRIEAYMKKSLA